MNTYNGFVISFFHVVGMNETCPQVFYFEFIKYDGDNILVRDLRNSRNLKRLIKIPTELVDTDDYESDGFWTDVDGNEYIIKRRDYSTAIAMASLINQDKN